MDISYYLKCDSIPWCGEKGESQPIHFTHKKILKLNHQQNIFKLNRRKKKLKHLHLKNPSFCKKKNIIIRRRKKNVLQLRKRNAHL